MFFAKFTNLMQIKEKKMKRPNRIPQIAINAVFLLISLSI